MDSQKSLDPKEWFIHDRINLWRNLSEWFYEPDGMVYWPDPAQMNDSQIELHNVSHTTYTFQFQ